MLRREFLKAGLALAALPLLEPLPSEPTYYEDMGFPRAWEELIARAETRAQDWQITEVEYANAMLDACEGI